MLKKKDLQVFTARKKRLQLYLKAAKGLYGKIYFHGRLDELKRLRKELK